jgi:hypothetical protein
MDSARKVVIGVALAAFATCFTWAVSTLFLSKPVLPTWAWVPFFFGIFPLMFFVISGGRGVRSWRLGQVSLSFAQLRARLPLAAIVVAMALFLVCLLMASTALWMLRNGGPATVNGLFYANSHGAYTQITETRYHQLQLAEQRVFTSIPAVFYLMGAIYLAWIVRRSREQYATFEGQPVHPAWRGVPRRRRSKGT